MIWPVAGRKGLEKMLALPPPETRTVRLVIDGTVIGQRTRVLVNGTPCHLQDATFVFLLRLVLARRRRHDGWATRPQLHLQKKSNNTTKLRAALRPGLPAGFQIIDRDGRGRFRLPDGVAVEIASKALLDHADETIQALARSLESSTPQ